MSAFIVCDEHISAMLQAVNLSRHAGDGASYRWNGEARYFGGNTRDIGQKLVDENYRSVNYRYDEAHKPHTFTFKLTKEHSPAGIIKACDCYNYQSCETPDWRESEAHAIMRALRERAIRFLPGYDEAPWAIRE